MRFFGVNKKKKRPNNNNNPFQTPMSPVVGLSEFLIK